MGEDFHISFEGPEPRPDEDARYRTLEQSVDSIPAEFLDPKELLRIAHAWMDEQYEESRRLQEPFRMRLHQILQDIEALGDRELSESEEDDERNRIDEASRLSREMAKISHSVHGPLWACPKLTPTQQNAVMNLANLESDEDLVYRHHEKGQRLNSTEVIESIEKIDIPYLKARMEELQSELTPERIQYELAARDLAYWEGATLEAESFLVQATEEERAGAEQYVQRCKDQVEKFRQYVDNPPQREMATGVRNERNLEIATKSSRFYLDALSILLDSSITKEEKPERIEALLNVLPGPLKHLYRKGYAAVMGAIECNQNLLREAGYTGTAESLLRIAAKGKQGQISPKTEAAIKLSESGSVFEFIPGLPCISIGKDAYAELWDAGLIERPLGLQGDVVSGGIGTPFFIVDSSKEAKDPIGAEMVVPRELHRFVWKLLSNVNFPITTTGEKNDVRSNTVSFLVGLDHLPVDPAFRWTNTAKVFHGFPSATVFNKSDAGFDIDPDIYMDAIGFLGTLAERYGIEPSVFIHPILSSKNEEETIYSIGKLFPQGATLQAEDIATLCRHAIKSRHGGTRKAIELVRLACNFQIDTEQVERGIEQFFWGCNPETLEGAVKLLEETNYLASTFGILLQEETAEVFTDSIMYLPSQIQKCIISVFDDAKRYGQPLDPDFNGFSQHNLPSPTLGAYGVLKDLGLPLDMEMLARRIVLVRMEQPENVQAEEVFLKMIEASNELSGLVDRGLI